MISFHTPMSTMLTNKHNICLETIVDFFLFPRIDVSEGRRLTSEPNEHTYGMWRMILHEFNMKKLIRIVQNNNLRMEFIYEIYLDVLISNTTSKCYQFMSSDFNDI